jgi:hypothetical protein
MTAKMYVMVYEHFFKGLSLYLEVRIWIHIRVISRIRLRKNVMWIHNTLLRAMRYALCHVFRGKEEEPKTFSFFSS